METLRVELVVMTVLLKNRTMYIGVDGKNVYFGSGYWIKVDGFVDRSFFIDEAQQYAQQIILRWSKGLYIEVLGNKQDLLMFKLRCL